MGFGTTFANVASGALTDAQGWVQDFAPLLTIFVGLGVFALAVTIISKAVR